MKLEFDTVEKVPQWAVSGFVNNDWSGTDDSDMIEAKAWEKRLNDEGWSLVSPVDGSENEFEPHPAFGLACATVDFTIQKI